MAKKKKLPTHQPTQHAAAARSRLRKTHDRKVLNWSIDLPVGMTIPQVTSHARDRFVEWCKKKLPQSFKPDGPITVKINEDGVFMERAFFVPKGAPLRTKERSRIILPS